MIFNAELARLDREMPQVADALRSIVANRLAADASKRIPDPARRDGHRFAGTGYPHYACVAA